MDLPSELAGITGDNHVLTGQDVLDGYVTDWTRRYRGTAACAVVPGSAAEVAEVVRVCARRGVAIVPQGGNTGLAGGSVPWRPGPDCAAGARHAEGADGDAADRPAVVLSTRRLRTLGPVDLVAGQVTAGAGVTIAELNSHAGSAGLAYGVDLASRDSATVGGTIATNAGGVHTVRYGYTRAQLLGVEAVLADGRVISHLAGLMAENAGYDLMGLLAGSEGTLALITGARLRLWPVETGLTTVLAGVESIAAAAGLFAEIRGRADRIQAAEYFEADGVALVCRVAGLPPPLSREYPGYLLVETAGADAVQRMAELTQLEDAAVAMDPAGRARLWEYRERHTEAISAAGIPHKLDVAVPMSELEPFRRELASATGPYQTIVFGHIGVGNVHVNVLGPDPDDERVDEAVLRLATSHGGTVSAEHGIGRAKARWLPLSRSEEEIAAMRAVKSALDPSILFNPGVLFS
ncbi:MAG: FAD-binding oxidoreductase [Micromonosporaceae bacterium]